MTKTLRKYNLDKRVPNYHPYTVDCRGHCRSCKDPTVSKRRRLAYSKVAEQEVKAVF